MLRNDSERRESEVGRAKEYSLGSFVILFTLPLDLGLRPDQSLSRDFLSSNITQMHTR